MGSIACCGWWFLLGLFLGWLLNWLLMNFLRKDAPAAQFVAPVPVPVPVPVPPSFPAGIDIAAAAAAGIHVKGAEDIIIIEGIGPKIKELFNQNGITTFAQIAKMTVSEMSAILDKGGSRFKLANPGSWAQQAKLADENRWTELKKLQDELYAGVELVDDNDAGKKS